ncbi:unnamed protein product [Fraxinus pennsylvanica]|uniref:Uncharacterized protein n=1 Tax=Fraxinus pennsylvanica TaxID=56036 RepID=A0AAD2DQ59_9LAMI|nr:unnamed protein product [Fraxinus pennsylvanica]
MEELLRASADYTVKDSEGRSALEKAASDEIKDFTLRFGNGVDAEGAGIYCSQTLDDFDSDDVEQMGRELMLKRETGVHYDEKDGDVLLAMVAYEVGSSMERFSGNRMVVFGLHEEFLKLEKDLESRGFEIVVPEYNEAFGSNDDDKYNYMGMLPVEGTYDKMEALLNQNIHPVDILLMMAASEGDKPKIEELLRAGADYTVKRFRRPECP